MNSLLKRILSGFILIALVSFVSSPRVFAQDTLIMKKKGGNKMTVKIKKDENGKVTELDTVIDANNKLAVAGLEEYMKKLDLGTVDIDDNMTDLDENMKELDLRMSKLTGLDSSLRDSIRDITKKMFIRGKHGHRSMMRHMSPDNSDFNFEFTMPEMPEISEIPGFENVPVPPAPPLTPGMRSFRGHGRTLSDVLGDIPMDNVKSYSVKERKHGKRIIIDVDDEGRHQHKGNSVIIMERPRHVSHSHSAPRVEREIYRE